MGLSINIKTNRGTLLGRKMKVKDLNEVTLEMITKEAVRCYGCKDVVIMGWNNLPLLSGQRVEDTNF